MAQQSGDSSGELDLPGSYCPGCTTVRFDNEPSCANCGSGRPASGWPPLAEADDPFLGSIVDSRFIVHQRLSEGTTTTVYRAGVVGQHRQVVLKVARFEATGSMQEHVRETVSREVRAVGALESDHVVPLYEFLELDAGTTIIVTDYVDGVTLHEKVLDPRHLATRRIAEIVADVADLLVEAHDAGLVHRDIKPTNVMLEEEGDGGESTYLLDFGAVRMKAAAAGMTDGFVGTPLFASPEQVGFDQIGPASDIYSLGATFYFALTGRPPFGGEDVEHAMQAHLGEMPPRPSEVARGRGLPAELDELVEQMLHKPAADRPTAGDVAERLAAIDLAGADDTVVDPAPAFDQDHEGLEGPTPSETLIYRPQSSAETTLGEKTEPLETTPADRPGDEAEPAGAAGESWPGIASESGGREISPESSLTFLAAETDQGGEFASRPETHSFHSLSALSETTSVRIELADDAPAAATSEGDVVFADADSEIWAFARGADHPSSLSRYASEIGDLAVGSQSLWVAEPAGNCRRLDRREGQLRQTLEAPADRRITAIETAGVGESVVVGLDDGTCLLRRGPGSGTARIDCDFDRVADLDLQPAADTFCAAGRGGRVSLFSPLDSPKGRDLLQDAGEILAVALSSSAELVAVVTTAGELTIYHATIGQPVTELGDIGEPPRALFFDPNDDLRALRIDDGEIVVWDCIRDAELTRITTRVPAEAVH